MPKNKSYSVYVEGLKGVKPGTQVEVVGQGTVQKDGTVLVDSFTSEDGPNSADVAMDNMMGSRGAEGVMGDDEGY